MSSRVSIHRRWWAGLAMVLTVAAVYAGAAAAQELPGLGVTLRAGKASWTSAEPVSAVFVELLEELGYEVEVSTFASNPIAYLAIFNGDLDYWPHGWFPVHRPQLPAGFESQASIIGELCRGCGLEGYLVDIPSIEKYGIRTLEDFKRPEVREAFDANGDGRADLFGCPPGWGCYETIEFHMDAYGLRPYVNHVSADYTATFADALARIRAGQPTLYYTWTPNDTILLAVPGEHVMWIGVPELRLAPAHEGFSPEALVAHGLAAAVEDPLPMGFVPNDINVVANNRFLDRHPAAARLLESVRLPLEWISEATLRISQGEDTDEDIRAIAREWIEANREQVDAWLEEARAAAR
ncbi:MAG: glycine betaine/L-proline ABC transporter substrate-binding protein ProX [Firmicutes bacterium]|nr:glycine betaine/L-proline ABC transporter substrate-binding protein ProX [Bacillota bacterium]